MQAASPEVSGTCQSRSEGDPAFAAALRDLEAQTLTETDMATMRVNGSADS
jgi:hypothetical protein